MSPLRESSSWTDRYQEEMEIDPLKRYYLIFEGIHTEVKYFEGIVRNRKDLGINNEIELIILYKEGEIESYSHPKKLLELISIKKEEHIKLGSYEEDIDEFVIIFDRDSYRDGDEFLDFVAKAEIDNILAVTSPCFEFWLILHKENSVEEKILISEDQIFQNLRCSTHHTFTSKLFSEIFGTNPKSNLDFEIFKNHLDVAVKQEKKLTQDIKEFSEKIGSNIGILIETLRIDPRNRFL